MAADTTSPEDLGPDYVQSLARGLSVITAFSEESPALTLSEVAEKTKLTRATARRFLLTLVQLGYMRTDGKNFSLTPRVMELGYSYLASQGLSDVIAPRLRELSERAHESASAAILDGGDIVYIARSAGRKIMQVRITVGTRFPAAATSMGRVLLAALPEAEATALLHEHPAPALTAYTTTSASELTRELALVRQQGYALVDQELELGLRSLALPIHDTAGAVVAAINVSTTSGQPLDATLTQLLPALQECASAIEGDLRAGAAH